MSTSPPPPRRFLPEPLETTTRSSKSVHGPSPDLASSHGSSAKAQTSDTSPTPPQTKPRRFLPQPVEESTRSSRKKAMEHVEDSPSKEESDGLYTQLSTQEPAVPDAAVSRPSTTPRRFAPEPIETSSHSSRRRSPPQPIETSTRHSKDRDNPPDDAPSKPRRKFAPEPMETSTRISKDKTSPGEQETQTARPRRKFLPEPIETTTRRRRNTDIDNAEEELSKSADSSASSRASSGPRKFSPELLETAKGSYRRVHPSTSDPKESLPPRRPASPRPSQEVQVDQATGLEESPFSAAAIARRRTEVVRQHSFVVPDLPMIESTTEEDSSETPSLSESPSSVSTVSRQDTGRPPIQSSYTDYVLQLASETVSESELQEQAMAAYINERPHEPVDHFAIDADDDDPPLAVPKFQGEQGVDAQTFRRSSVADLHLELQSMQKHHEQLDSAKKDRNADDTPVPSRFSAAALASRQAVEAKQLNKAKKARAAEEDSELARMMAAAAPPMLGGSLVFPFTITPKMTRCDPDQPPRPRNIESHDESTDPVTPRLWTSNKGPQNNADGGLWMGMCQAGTWQPVNHAADGLRSGIQTPAALSPVLERNNPFESMTPGRDKQTSGRQRPYSGMNFLPLTPPQSSNGDDGFTTTIDKKLSLEKQIDEEFPPRVITQIYNYLSLGYPSLAHMFDEELSKISRIPVEELRKDDNLVDAKGYVGAPEGDGAAESEVVGKCKRWEALRLYVREWARQSPHFMHESMGPVVVSANDDWGSRARKGSWGF
ncbi:hypothetical protein A1O1_05342 [Capronia coronata CBS 617.96]|uniref:Uncharacterized protein n=1 Tax=Capronia coronata CBS 617.96 TaxID=1182541 RepID=W9Y6G1_9EURO|nr:uncharacterized protein A1O1_05342 [Capronia coronata CBS 617.96]EXJ88412.1 hypothetical protein A1O1_05342 [Capronia coronata CBS 617.96]